MKVKFLGGVRTVTGSATLLEKDPLKWLVDCGMHQGGKTLEERNRGLQPYHAEDLAFVLLTHAHIDHSGLIPKLVKEGFRGRVICTKATSDLCEVMLRDSGHIQEIEAEWQNRKGKRSGKEAMEPLYTIKDAEESLHYFKPIRYDEIFSPPEGMKVRFQDAGHILGSAIIEIWSQEGGSDDACLRDQPTPAETRASRRREPLRRRQGGLGVSPRPELRPKAQSNS